MYDAIIVGARCAGSPLAMLLARNGRRVLLVDKATFPSDTLSTHAIQTPGVARLQRWDLLGQVKATNAPPIRRVHFDQGEPLVLDGQYPRVDAVDAVYCVRRTLLDSILLNAAVAAGAEVREGFTVKDLVVEDGRVTGIRGHDRGGAEITERAPMVIGADGHRSLVATAVAAPAYRQQPPLSCAYYAYFSDVPMEGFEVYGRERRAIGVAPTNDGQICVYTAWPRDEFHAYRADIEGNFFATLDLVPKLGERVRAGRRTERFYGTADLPNFFRKPYGPGWALVGDAGYALDPITGQGIADAFRDAELLASALEAGDMGREPSMAALASYEKQRNAAAMPMFELTTQLASLTPMAEENQALFSSLRGHPDQIDRFFGVLTGSVPVASFFSPANLIRLLGPIGFARMAWGRARRRQAAGAVAPAA